MHPGTLLNSGQQAFAPWGGSFDTDSTTGLGMICEVADGPSVPLTAAKEPGAGGALPKQALPQIPVRFVGRRGSNARGRRGEAGAGGAGGQEVQNSLHEALQEKFHGPFKNPPMKFQIS